VVGAIASYFVIGRPQGDTVAVEPGFQSVFQEKVRSGVATIGRQIGATWEGGAGTFIQGGAIDPSQIMLKSGMAQIDLYSGVSLTMRGPVTFDLVSHEHVSLVSGDLYLSVPREAQDFTLEVFDTVITGKDFECGVSAGARSLIRAYRGEVGLQYGTNEALLKKGYTYQNGKIEKSVQGTPAYLSIRDMRSLEKVTQKKQYEQWLRSRSELRSHPDLITYYDFELDDGNEQELTDESRFDRAGAIVGCRWVKGRWPEKNALEFKNSGDRIRMTIPGVFDELTMIVWMRVDGFDRRFNPIMLTDEFEDGEIHWQIRSSGQMDAGIKQQGSSRSLFVSQKSLGAGDLGQWNQYVITYSKGRGTPRHYVNGILRPLSVNSLSGVDTEAIISKPIRIGRAELGNWSPARTYDRWPARNLNGRIDEFAIFSRELSADEILALYEKGDPEL